MAYVEHVGTHNRSPSHTDTTVKSSKSKTFRAKLEHARPRIILLAACLVYFITVLATFQVGVAIVSNVASPQYERVNDQLRAHSSALHKQRIIQNRLETILASQLKRGFMDTHEDCLVRGLEKADHELLGLGFRYPDVREQVMEWTMENCGRLQFAPQVVVEEPTPQEAVLTHWAAASYRALRIAEEAVGFVKQKLSWIWAFLRSSSQPQNAPLDVEESAANANNSTTEQILPERTLPQAPYGFALECDQGQPCRLFYPAELSVRFDLPKASPEFLAQLAHHTTTLQSLDANLASVQKTIIKASVMMSYLEIPLLICSVIVFVNSMTLKAIPSHDVPGKEAMYLAKSVLMQQATHLALISLDKSPAIFPSIQSASIFGFFTVLLSLSMVLKFFLHGSQLETVYNAWAAMRHLYLVAPTTEFLGEEEIKMASQASSSGRKEERANTQTSPQTKRAVVPVTTRASSKPHHRLADPTTSVQEDLHASITLLREQREKQAAVSANIYADTDTDSASDAETFVDLAGGMSTQVSDAGCGWSIVG